MKDLIVVTTTSVRENGKDFERSCLKFGYELYVIEHFWTGFLNKIHYTYQFLKTVKDKKYFIYGDHFDSVFLQGPDKLPEMNGYWQSAEKASYPFSEWSVHYPEVKSPYKYVNGGGFGGEISRFLEIYEANPPTDEMNDQVWSQLQYFKNKDKDWWHLDTDCHVFQSIAFTNMEETFDLSRSYNKITDSYPSLYHFNGKTDGSLVLQALDNIP